MMTSRNLPAPEISVNRTLPHYDPEQDFEDQWAELEARDVAAGRVHDSARAAARHGGIDRAIGLMRLDGHEPDAELVAILRRWADGELSDAQRRAAMDARYAAIGTDISARLLRRPL